MNAVTQELLPPEEKMLEAYSPYRAKVAELVARNAAMVFDYASPDGEKEARSYIYKLRQSKKPIDEVRKAEKAASLEYGRRVDAQGKALITVIDQMIEQHMAPIREIEERERQRIEDINAQLDFIRSITGHAAMSSDELRSLLSQLQAVVVDDAFQEFEEEARQLQTQQIALLEEAIDGALKREADERELAELRAQAADREARDREKRIAEEAAQRARAEAEAAARSELAAAEARERAAQERADRLERESREAEERAQRELQKKAEQERREQEKREADRIHLARINNEVAAALVTAGLSDDDARKVVVAIASGKVPHTRITY